MEWTTPEDFWNASNYEEMLKFLAYKVHSTPPEEIRLILHEFIEHTYLKGTLYKYTPSRGKINPFICTALCYWLRTRGDKYKRRKELVPTFPITDYRDSLSYDIEDENNTHITLCDVLEEIRSFNANTYNVILCIHNGMIYKDIAETLKVKIEVVRAMIKEVRNHLRSLGYVNIFQ